MRSPSKKNAFNYFPCSGSCQGMNTRRAMQSLPWGLSPPMQPYSSAAMRSTHYALRQAASRASSYSAYLVIIVLVSVCHIASPSSENRYGEVQLQNQATVPSLLGMELETNPFLRSDQAEIRQSLGEPSQMHRLLASNVQPWSCSCATRHSESLML